VTASQGRTEIRGSVVLVTGAGAGIGRAAALLLAEHGAAVVAADVQGELAGQTARQITDSGGDAVAVQADVSREDEVEAMVAAAVSTYGALDAAFNNAGLAPPAATIDRISTENWDRALAVNLRGVWLCMKHELAVMLAQGHGSIVNTSSVAGLVGLPGSAAYAAAKHGIIGLTRSAAAEHGRRGVRVNALAPGLTRTDMVLGMIASGDLDEEAHLASVPLGRMAQPREIAEAVLWLASPLSSFVTGHVLAVDGGETAI
jgi:NAD(P)-dependent dehydrogenase (short-subunit alcohol dehydrogenase family)